jgi:hypothetical protein
VVLNPLLRQERVTWVSSLMGVRDLKMIPKTAQHVPTLARHARELNAISDL